MPGRFTSEFLDKKGSSNFDEQTAVLGKSLGLLSNYRVVVLGNLGLSATLRERCVLHFSDINLGEGSLISYNLKVLPITCRYKGRRRNLQQGRLYGGNGLA
ncbi:MULTISPECIES: hypothetical protein [Moorena]|uniref:hypothetical protein n=1 Tax=Moorena TaxID=1155738 RepID=UPI001180D838|nr:MULTISPECIES: hypothetical protein [Moorena]NEP34062.1 hypothetical protein [Moorena sp. SIO3B2]NEP69950.1 hypothetical protein [Moorena sp. SIO3A5]NEQ06543.1 hypothetical protein [Moorena sp. SIO4E2]NER91985.1 hypothetical protein [Moorena sp. SIO3A2]